MAPFCLPLAALLLAATSPTSASGFSLQQRTARPFVASPSPSSSTPWDQTTETTGENGHLLRVQGRYRESSCLLPSSPNKSGDGVVFGGRRRRRGRPLALAAAASSGAEGGISRGGGVTTTTKTALQKFKAFAEKNFFLLGMVVAVSFARAFPALGKNGGVLRPELFIGQYGVTCIFLLSGLSLQLSELADAATHYKLNSLVQLSIFGAWPALVGLPLTRGLLPSFLPGLLPQTILDGLLILCCLPTTVNMCILLTSASGGSVASALSNAVISNLMGIFATPALLLRFFGESIELPFGSMVLKLCNKVLLPVAVGQALRATPAKELYTNNSKKFKRLQEMILLGIVWNAFCNAFTRGLGLELKHGIALLTILPIMHILSLTALFTFFKSKLLGFTRGESVAGTFCASQKTLAFGLPLINTIFEGNPNLAAYCAPIMFMHPLQLILDSLCVPAFTRYVEEEEEDTD